MIFRCCKLGAAVAALLAVGCDPVSVALPADPSPLRLGVTAHFAQGWPEALWPAIGAVRAGTVREALGWRRVETAVGRYAFTAQNSGHIDRLCATKVPVVLVIEPRNPLYDGGETAHSMQAQEAFGAFVGHVADRFGTCLAAIEVGNEINGAKAMTGAAASDRAASHTRLMRAVWQATKPRHPEVALLGGSVNTVGTGFLNRLFAQGLLNWVDGIAIHPYRRTPEGLDWEIAALRDAMVQQGAVKAIWATEFGLAAPDPATAPDYLLSTAVLLSASGVHEAQWYALADDTSFPTMGLLRANAQPKPAATTFSMLTGELLSRGPASRLSVEEPALHRYRFGADREVVWGAPRSFEVPAGAVIRNSVGARVEGVVRIGASPLIISSEDLQLGPREVLADSLYDFAQPVWSYSARGQTATAVTLRAVHSNYATALGAPNLGAGAVNPLGMVLPALRGPIAVSLRYRAPADARVAVQACLYPKTPGKGSGAFEVLTPGDLSRPQDIPPAGLQISREINVKSGDFIDFATSARGGAAFLAYRFRIALAGTQASRETLRCN